HPPSSATSPLMLTLVFLCNDPPTTALYPLSLHDALPIWRQIVSAASVHEMTRVQTGELTTGFTPGNGWGLGWCVVRTPQGVSRIDRKSTRLNSSHVKISYAVFCLKKKTKQSKAAGLCRGP